jgi:hypothetical protein
VAGAAAVTKPPPAEAPPVKAIEAAKGKSPAAAPEAAPLAPEAAAPGRAVRAPTVREAAAALETKLKEQLADSAETVKNIREELSTALAEEPRVRRDPSRWQAVKAQIASLQREYAQAAKDHAGIAQLIARLQRRYEAARQFSYSKDSGLAVRARAAGRDPATGKPVVLDEMSRKPVTDGVGEVDHVVPIKWIVEMEGWLELMDPDPAVALSDAQKAVLSMVENLRLMEGPLNGSKGGKSWAEWTFGRRYYGEAVWSEMTRLELSLREVIQAKIKKLVAERR